VAYEMKENTGSLFANDRKETDNHPDYKGQALIDGQEYWLSAWKKRANNGNAYLSFSFKPKEARQQTPAVGSYTADDDLDDSVPF